MNKLFVFIGVDPGWKGAAACSIGKLTFVQDCPGDPGGIGFIVGQWTKYQKTHEIHVLVERVHQSPTFGAIGNFRLGQNLGSWETALAIYNISYETVTPLIWQKLVTHEAGAKIKEKAWRFAKRKFPLLGDKLGNKVPSKTAKAQGYADALCIMAYAMKEFNL